MGRGDKRSRKGKIFKGSYGNSRLQREKKVVAPEFQAKSAVSSEVVAVPAKVAKKA